MTPIIKFGFFTDLHARNDTPQQRVDNFRDSILIKLHEIGEIFEKENVDYVLFGGDLGHTPDPSYTLLNALLKELKSWNKPIIGVVGSHDYFGYQKKTLDRTLLGTMRAAGILELVDTVECPYFIIPCEAFTGVVITGTTHSYDIVDHPERINQGYVKEDALLQIQLVHCDLFHKEVPWRHILIDDIATRSDLVLSGHIHSGWDKPIKINNTTFFNPGSIARLEKSKLQRIPRVLIIEVYDKKLFAIKDIPLQSALLNPFKEDDIKESFEEATPQDITKLLEFIEATDIEITDIKKLLSEFSKKENYSNTVLETAFELLEKAKLKS
jgi:DNA repair exonuclease SbcCD nuclease subunit